MEPLNQDTPEPLNQDTPEPLNHDTPEPLNQDTPEPLNQDTPEMRTHCSFLTPKIRTPHQSGHFEARWCPDKGYTSVICRFGFNDVNEATRAISDHNGTEVDSISMCYTEEHGDWTPGSCGE